MGFLDNQELLWAIPVGVYRALELDVAVALSGIRGHSDHVFGIEQRFTVGGEGSLRCEDGRAPEPTKAAILRAPEVASVACVTALAGPSDRPVTRAAGS